MIIGTKRKFLELLTILVKPIANLLLTHGMLMTVFRYQSMNVTVTAIELSTFVF